MWPSWAARPNEPSGFRGRKAILNHASALVSACPCQLTSEDIKQHYLPTYLPDGVGEREERNGKLISMQKRTDRFSVLT